MSSVIIDRIAELSETKGRLQKIREISSNWKMVIIVSVGALTLKTCAEQIAMAIR